MAEGIFVDEKFSQTTDLLRHLIDNSDQIPLILGETGTGKTTLLKHFSNLAANEWALCLVEATPTLQPYQFFAHLSRCFGISDQRPGLDRVVQCLEDLNKSGRLPVILIDDAHQLPIATIIMLLRLYERHHENQLLVKIVLFAHPQIDRLLKASQIQAMDLEMIQALYLSPMSKARTEQFIQFLIQQTDPESSFQITQSQLRSIYRASGGNQASIVSRLQQLQNRYSNGDKFKKGGHSFVADFSTPTIIGSGVLILALIVTAVVLQDQINALFEETQDMESTLQSTYNNKINTIQSDNSLTPQTLHESQLVLPALTAPTKDKSIYQAPLSEAKIGFIESEIEQPETLGVVQEPLIRELPAEVLSEKVEPEAMQQSEKQAIAGRTVTLSELRTKGEDSSAIVEAVSMRKKGEQPIPHKPLTDKLKVQESAVISATPAPSAKSGSRPITLEREAWLLAQKPTSYTLQIVGLRSEEGIKKFVEKHRLSGQIAYFRKMRGGAPWFSVLYGIYPDKKSAMVAIKTLPQALQKSGVWPRSLKSIQKQLQKR